MSTPIERTARRVSSNQESQTQTGDGGVLPNGAQRARRAAEAAEGALGADAGRRVALRRARHAEVPRVARARAAARGGTDWAVVPGGALLCSKKGDTPFAELDT